jgi:hypothetical protein
VAGLASAPVRAWAAATFRHGSTPRWRHVVFAALTGVAMLVDGLTWHQPGVVQAYVDPGSGSLVLQLVGAIFVGLLFQLKRLSSFARRVWVVVRRRDRV